MVGRWQPVAGPIFNGALDETRTSAVARSADWITTEYSNQSTPGSFASIGGESGVSNPIISAIVPGTASAGTAVVITGANFGATQGTGAVTFNGVTGIPSSWSNTQIVVPVPSGATTGNVVVTTNGVASIGYGFTGICGNHYGNSGLWVGWVGGDDTGIGLWGEPKHKFHYI